MAAIVGELNIPLLHMSLTAWLHMVFTRAMKKPIRKLHPDSDVILAFGGPTALAKKLGMDPSTGGVQRVQNWMTRGIPRAVKWDHQDVFGEPPAKRAGEAA